jgi:hypothetical protein
MSIAGEPDESMVIDAAYCAAIVDQRYGPAVTFRLVVGRMELPGC